MAEPSGASIMGFGVARRPPDKVILQRARKHIDTDLVSIWNRWTNSPQAWVSDSTDPHVQFNLQASEFLVHDVLLKIDKEYSAPLGKAQSLMWMGKYAEAIPPFRLALESFGEALDHIVNGGPDLVAGFGAPRPDLQPDPAVTQDEKEWRKHLRERLREEYEELLEAMARDELDPALVLKFAQQNLIESLLHSEQPCRRARRMVESGVLEVPAAEIRYERHKRSYRKAKDRFALMATVWTAIGLLLGAWLFSLSPWLVPVAVVLWLIAIAFEYLTLALTGEAIVSAVDSKELVRRDGSFWK
jgi:hypothetical protein